MARTKRESDRRRRKKKWQSKERAEWRRLQQRNLSKLGLLKKKRVASVPQREQLPSTPEPPLPLKRNRAVVPEHHIVTGKRVKVSESRILAREKKIRAKA